MYDGFKIRIFDKLILAKLLDGSFGEFIQHTNMDTGQVQGQTLKYYGLTIHTFPSGLIEVKGSFHKYYNNIHGILNDKGKSHNYNDFTFDMLVEVIDSLQHVFGINLLQASVCNLEFGLNIHTYFNPNTLINSLLCFKWKPFSDMDIVGPGYAKQCRGSSQYIIKIYNKGLQNDLNQNILRIEKKIVTMRALKFGRINLVDLLKPALWHHCKRELIEMFNDILINEPIDKNYLTRNEQKAYHNIVNQSNWAYYSRDQKKRNKKAFNNIITEYGKAQFKPVIIALMNEKFEQLI